MCIKVLYALGKMSKGQGVYCSELLAPMSLISSCSCICGSLFVSHGACGQVYSNAVCCGCCGLVCIMINNLSH